MLIRWKSGYVAYWVRGFYYVGIGAATGGWIAVAFSLWGGGFDLIRHKYSTIAALCFLANLPFALRRRRWGIRFGHQAWWLRVHWYFAGVGLALVFSHSALQPATWSGWVALGVASFAALTGVVTHLTRRYTRHYALRVHLVAVFLLLGGMIFHGKFKLHHPAFPLTMPLSQLRNAHNVPCAQCHPIRNVYAEYTCLLCHVHDTEAIRSTHASSGVTEAARCLDCHPVTWKGKTYSTGAVRPVSPEVFNFP